VVFQKSGGAATAASRLKKRGEEILTKKILNFSHANGRIQAQQK
jgi:hypothetical protein